MDNAREEHGGFSPRSADIFSTIIQDRKCGWALPMHGTVEKTPDVKPVAVKQSGAEASS